MIAESVAALGAKFLEGGKRRDGLQNDDVDGALERAPLSPADPGPLFEIAGAELRERDLSGRRLADLRSD